MSSLQNSSSYPPGLLSRRCERTRFRDFKLYGVQQYEDQAHKKTRLIFTDIWLILRTDLMKRNVYRTNCIKKCQGNEKDIKRIVSVIILWIIFPFISLIAHQLNANTKSLSTRFRAFVFIQNCVHRKEEPHMMGAMIGYILFLSL